MTEDDVRRIVREEIAAMNAKNSLLDEEMYSRVRAMIEADRVRTVGAFSGSRPQ